MNRRNRGQVRIIEAFLALLIIFSSLAASSSLTATRNTAKHDDLSFVGLQVLIQLDSDGALGRLIDERDWPGLRDAVGLALPAGMSFNLTVYSEQIEQVNDVVVSNGGLNSQEVAFVEYVCVSRSPAFHSYLIRLYLAVAA
jgi:hypothetical protein